MANTGTPEQQQTQDQKLDAIIKKLEKKDKTAARFEYLKFGLPALGALIVFIVGLAQYVATSTHEARKPFLKQQTTLCIQASDAVARLATTSDPKEWRDAWGQFWKLYFGPLHIVEDVGDKSHRVTQAMVKFGEKLNSPEVGSDPKALPLGPLKSPVPEGTFTWWSLELAEACQGLAQSWWRIW